MKLKMKKKVKGMTLIEVIVALAIFVVMTLMMVQVGAVTKSIMMQTNHLNRKTAAESPIASVQDVFGMNEFAATMLDGDNNPMVVDSTPTTFTITVGNNTANQSVVNAVKYSYQVAEDAKDDPYFDTNMRGHLAFYVIDESAQTPAK